jgi:hypothetical protein
MSVPAPVSRFNAAARFTFSTTRPKFFPAVCIIAA